MTAEAQAPPAPVRPAYAPAATRLIDRYILRETLRPLGVALAVVLLALVLERLLRLFDLVANRGGPIEEILKMAANLIPHYLGLALPAAFFISIFVVVTKFGEDNEFEALQSTGLSVRRISRPFLWLGVVLAFGSIALYGFIQPYSRYAYRAIYHAVINAAWDATVTAAAFIDAGKGVTVTADEVDATGRRLSGVFVHQVLDDGSEVVTTGATGSLRLSPDRTRLFLTLDNGTQIRTTPAGRVDVGHFGRLTLDRPFDLDPPPFRARGDSERELTLVELWEEQHNPDSVIAPGRLKSELNARLVRALSLPFMPLLAVPMGMAAKRAKRGPGIALAAVLLIIYHHSIQLGESLGDVGRASPALAVWTPFAAFAVLSLLLFHRAQVRPGENPFSHAFEAIDSFWIRVARLVRRRDPAAP
jgi:lipopolysaccharide export system permease protein